MIGKILIVEDEAPTALNIEKRLRNLGHEVCGIVASGEEALSQAAAEPRPRADGHPATGVMSGPKRHSRS